MRFSLKQLFGMTTACAGIALLFDLTSTLCTYRDAHRGQLPEKVLSATYWCGAQSMFLLVAILALAWLVARGGGR